MREPVPASKGLRDIAWRNQGTLGTFPTELAIQHMSDDTLDNLDQISETTSSSQHSSKSQSAGFWTSAVEFVTKGKFTKRRCSSYGEKYQTPFHCCIINYDISLSV